MSRRYDVLIVGTGAAGGLLAWKLATAGAEVLSLEYGPPAPGSALMSLEPYWRAYQRLGAAEMQRCLHEPGPGSWKRAPYFLFKDGPEPYVTAGQAEWFWRRYRLVGGRSVYWNGVSPRMSPRDFQAGSEDGFGPDWPLGYRDLEPYYDQAEELIGVCGPRDLDHPEWPRGKFLPPQPFRCGELILQRAVAGLRRPDLVYTHEPKAILTRPRPGRAACHYCGACAEGCAVGAKYDAAQVLLPQARASGHWTLRPGAAVAEVLADVATGRARGVRYVDRATGEHHSAEARTVVLAASTIETARILLNSKSRQHPAGIGNGSGEVGRHLKDHIECNISGFLPQLYGRGCYPDEGYTYGAYVPRFNRSYQKKLGYIRGFQTQSGSGKGLDLQTPGVGAALKQAVTDRYEASVGAVSFGERLDSPANYVDLDPRRVDAFGTPLARIHAEPMGENERLMFRDMRNQLLEIFTAAGAEDITVSAAPPSPGTSEHESGTCRMGSDPGHSVTNQFGQSHEVGNLYICDLSLLPQQTEKSPTLTLLALTLRNGDYLLEQLRQGAA